MKLLNVIFVSCLFFSINITSAFSENKLLFCFNVDSIGQADWDFNSISFRNVNKPILCLILIDKPLIDQRYVTFKLLKENENCEFELQKVYVYDIKPGWNWFYYKFYFKKSGVYKVIVEDENEKFICEDILRLFLYY